MTTNSGLDEKTGAMMVLRACLDCKDGPLVGKRELMRAVLDCRDAWCAEWRKRKSAIRSVFVADGGAQ